VKMRRRHTLYAYKSPSSRCLCSRFQVCKRKKNEFGKKWKWVLDSFWTISTHLTNQVVQAIRKTPWSTHLNTDSMIQRLFRKSDSYSITVPTSPHSVTTQKINVDKLRSSVCNFLKVQIVSSRFSFSYILHPCSFLRVRPLSYTPEWKNR
jgi:hypothetical protein